MVTPNAFTTLGKPVDLGAIEVDSYVVAAANDHIVPWENAARSVELLGGDTRFVLSSSGHIQALVNPVDNPKSSYTVDGAQRAGSWWPDYAQWLAERSGDLDPRTGSAKPGANAPGTYVHAN